MNKTILAATVVMALAPATALAQERVGDAALGALSGAVVLGPVGAVAGAVVGYSAGPSIARSWGLKGSRQQSRRAARPVKSTPAEKRGAGPAASPAAAAPTAQAQNTTAPPTTARPPARGGDLPPVQSLE